MRGWSLKAVLAFGLLAVAIAPAADAADAGAPAPPSLPACIRVATESRWVPYGYNHVVILENGCSKAATCKISTDVNPQVLTAEIEPTKTVEVTTIMASPASQFVAKVTCSLH
jgi:hypothetical protein